MLTTEQRNELIRAALAKKHPGIKDFSHDRGLATRPVGHASGIETSTKIIRSYRNDHRPRSQHVEPQQVINTLRDAGVKHWVLMGLYGYAGYLAAPRATQDVDVLVAESEIDTASAAIQARWPQLEMDRQEIVVRFRDPGEIAIDGEMKHVIDLMLPSNECHEAILLEQHCIDGTTGHRIPNLEAACASKFVALVSPYRQWERKQQDAVDFRGIVAPNVDTIDREKLSALGDLVYAGRGAELLEFLELAIQQKPFPT